MERKLQPGKDEGQEDNMVDFVVPSNWKSTPDIWGVEERGFRFYGWRGSDEVRFEKLAEN